MLSNSGNSSIRIQSIYKISFIAVICFSSINVQGSVPNVVNSEENQVNFQEINLNSGDSIKPNFADTDNLKDDDLCQDNIKAEESSENKSLEVSDNLYSRLSNTFFLIKRKLWKCCSLSFVKTKLWDFCGILSDIFLPLDYRPTTIGEFFAGYIPVDIILFSCLNPQGNLKTLLKGTGVVQALHYYFSTDYYRIMPTNIVESILDCLPTITLGVCLDPRLHGDLKESLRGVGITYALHYYFSRYYYRKD